ncbi:hypothetical protein [Dokdonella sp.]|uniref:hypothetical protein n=1 Tax=Dokdonella sp. TaxID=2291710 RepID=UPI0031BD57FC|nr:hypothetical protein [Dokdonella sp.]
MLLERCLDALLHADLADPEAAQQAVQTCTRALLDANLWAWALGITVFCAAVGALIGYVRGRWLVGLAWGAALGPIGWLVMLLTSSQRVECPACSRGNPPGARSCRHCGVNLQAAARASARATNKRIDSGRGW